MAKEGSAETTIRNIRRKTRRKYGAESTCVTKFAGYSYDEKPPLTLAYFCPKDFEDVQSSPSPGRT
jgi:hypothetical protein